MYYHNLDRNRLHIHDQTERYLNPQDISLPPGYSIEVFAQGLDLPSCIVFTENGDIIIAESGYISGKPALLLLSQGRTSVISDDFITPVTGINYKAGNIYVSDLGRISVVKMDGSKSIVLEGLPSQGDYYNSRVDFGPEGKLYFGQGTCTNSGVVGNDNHWVHSYPQLYDNVGGYVILKGQNFITSNMLSLKGEKISTGAFSPYGVSNNSFEIRKGIVKASGSILKVNPDGSGLEQVAWGLRYPSYLKFDNAYRLFVSNIGYDVRGSRPIANAFDEFQLVEAGKWYGWPDYSGGEPVSSPKFRPESGPQPDLLFENKPDKPPAPFAVFPSNSYIFGFDFNYYEQFGNYGDVYIAEFGGGTRNDPGVPAPYAGVGHRISKINMKTNSIETFAINKSGFPSSITKEGGFGRPVDVVFGPDGAMYVVDLGTNSALNQSEYFPNTGVIWRIVKT